MRDNSSYGNLRCHCSCPSRFLLKATAHMNRVTNLNGDDGGFKLLGQAWNCGVDELAHDFTCCACSWRRNHYRRGGGQS